MKFEDLITITDKYSYWLNGVPGSASSYPNNTNSIEETVAHYLSKVDIQPRCALWEMYREPQRHYHTIQHIMDTLEISFEIGKQYDYDKEIVVAALAYHDCVYTIGSKQNEVLSAMYAERKLESWPQYRDESTNGYISPPEKRWEVRSIIRGTQVHNHPDSLEAAIVFDADLWGLGSSEAEFDQNTDNILREDLTVYSLEDVKAGRVQWITDFLKRDKIYYTAVGAEREDQARKNLERECKLFRVGVVQ